MHSSFSDTAPSENPKSLESFRHICAIWRTCQRKLTNQTDRQTNPMAPVLKYWTERELIAKPQHQVSTSLDADQILSEISLGRMAVFP